jgi:phosphoribosylglycinamide formyltransferase 1
VKKIAVFASGAGSNAAQIIDWFTSPPTPLHSVERGEQTPHIEVALIVCNKPGADVLKIAAAKNIPSLLTEKEKFFHGDAYIKELKESEINFIVLAGFLWKIPVVLIKAFPGSIINIHPALLPKYGGKGMYGQYVHQAVIDNKETESGITIHYVDEVYDNGDIIFQATCPVLPTDTASSLAPRVAALEHQHYPEVIERVISGIDPL